MDPILAHRSDSYDWLYIVRQYVYMENDDTDEPDECLPQQLDATYITRTDGNTTTPMVPEGEKTLRESVTQ